MKTLCIAIGNELRGDDGIAHYVAGRLQIEAQVLHVFQLTPELAPEIAAAERVIFVDADVQAAESYLRLIDPASARAAPIGHTMSPAELVRLAKVLYGFIGDAWLCGIPVTSFEGSTLSPTALKAAESAMELIHKICS